MKTQIVQLQESDLALVVSEKTLGSLTTNAKQIKEMVENALPSYDISNYNSENVDVAKKDKAMLNKASKALNAKRIEFEKEFMKPFAEFKTVIQETTTLISTCSGKIDILVKQTEEKEKQERMDKILEYFLSKNFDLVPIDKISQQCWLNKTCKDKEWKAGIDAAIDKVNNDLLTISTLEDSDTLKGIYLDRLDLGQAIQYGNTLKQNRERARLIEEQRIADQQKSAEPQRLASVPAPPTTKTEPAPVKGEPMLERAFKVVASRENIIALGDFMNARGIKFEKIEI